MRDNVIPFLSPATAAKSRILEALHRDGFALIEDAYPYMPMDASREAMMTAGRSDLAEECSRLNTRLMIMASWLLLQRSVREGDMSADDAQKELPQLAEFAAHAPTVEPETLPEPYRSFIVRSISLQERLTRIDAMLYPRQAA